MKNFPHQINQIPRLVSSLEVFRDLNVRNEDVLDDGILGYELARTGNYTFRGEPIGEDLIQRIIQEQQKPRSNQGPRTAARELRRFFKLLGFIDKDGVITPLGTEVLSAGGNLEDPNVREIWKQALRSVEILSENGRASNPYLIMLRLLNERPGIPSYKLSLALEAEDNTDEEFSRILALCDTEDWETVCQEIGASEHQIRNAIKILPSLAKQVEDVSVSDNSYYLANDEELINSEQQVQNGENEDLFSNQNSRLGRRHRRVSSAEIATTNQDDESTNSSGYTHTTDLSNAINTRRERTRRHHIIVRDFAEIIESYGYELIEDPMDCLALKEGSLGILSEMKTLDGSTEDERSCVRSALAQLLYYEQFESIELTNEAVQKFAVFETEISDEHKYFLERYNCLVLWKTENGFTGTDTALEFFRGHGISLLITA